MPSLFIRTSLPGHSTKLDQAALLTGLGCLSLRWRSAPLMLACLSRSRLFVATPVRNWLTFLWQVFDDLQKFCTHVEYQLGLCAHVVVSPAPHSLWSCLLRSQQKQQNLGPSAAICLLAAGARTTLLSTRSLQERFWSFLSRHRHRFHTRGNCHIATLLKAVTMPSHHFADHP